VIGEGAPENNVLKIHLSNPGLCDLLGRYLDLVGRNFVCHNSGKPPQNTKNLMTEGKAELNEILNGGAYSLLFEEGIYIVEDARVQRSEDKGQKSEAAVEAAEEIRKLVYLQSAQSEVLVVFHHVGGHLLSNEHVFLEKMLQAVKLSVEKVALLNTASNPSLSLNEVAGETYKTVLAFGAESTFLPEGVPADIATTYKGIKFLSLPSLTHIEGNLELKKAAWAGLKLIFGA
jgi:hypothetical protein